MTRLIVSADDFGLHSSINEAVEAAFEQGVLTNTSIIANGPAFDEAAAIARRHSGLSVGLHLNLIGSEPVAPAEMVSSLLDETGRFGENHFKLAQRLITGRVNPEHIRNEFEAQWKKCERAGLKLNHVDSHRHLHLLPWILKALRPALDVNRVTRLRWVSPPWFELDPRQAVKFGLSLFFRAYRRLVDGRFNMPDRFLGFFASGRIKPETVLSVLPRLSRGKSYEIGLHPGTDDDALKKAFGVWDAYFSYAFSWRGEFEALMSPKVRETIETQGIELISYADV